MISTELVARAALAGARIERVRRPPPPAPGGPPVRRGPGGRRQRLPRAAKDPGRARRDTGAPAWAGPHGASANGGRLRGRPPSGTASGRSPEGSRSPRFCAPRRHCRLAGLGAGEPDPFYDAAVRSMGTSWHALLVGAFEPGARVAIDKPPVDLWLQVASTKLFGFTTAALRTARGDRGHARRRRRLRPAGAPSSGAAPASRPRRRWRSCRSRSSPRAATRWTP